MHMTALEHIKRRRCKATKATHVVKFTKEGRVLWVMKYRIEIPAKHQRPVHQGIRRAHPTRGNVE
eukprot:886793-Prorocentrum_lima.AAC.1